MPKKLEGSQINKVREDKMGKLRGKIIKSKISSEAYEEMVQKYGKDIAASLFTRSTDGTTSSPVDDDITKVTLRDE